MKPEDFYFYTGRALLRVDRQEYGIKSWTIICPISFFHQHGYVIDSHLAIGNLLPEWMSEGEEAMFSSSKSPKKTQEKLLELGFQENEDFSQFCKSHDPFCYEDEK